MYVYTSTECRIWLRQSHSEHLYLYDKFPLFSLKSIIQSLIILLEKIRKQKSTSIARDVMISTAWIFIFKLVSIIYKIYWLTFFHHRNNDNEAYIRHVSHVTITWFQRKYRKIWKNILPICKKRVYLKGKNNKRQKKT